MIATSTLKLPGFRGRPRSAVTAIAVMVAAGGVMVGVTGSSASADQTGQYYVMPCPAAAVVTPALNTNLIENPGAVYYEQNPGGASQDQFYNEPPDCWTVSSPLPVGNAILSSFSPLPGGEGPRSFFGGATYTVPVADNVGLSVTGTQLINLSSLDAGGQPFELSGLIGGEISNQGTASLSATFEDASGNTLSVATIGPVTAAQRDDKSTMDDLAWYGTVPAGTEQVLVTLTSTGGTATANMDGDADALNLTIGSSAVPSGPLMQILPYTAPGTGSGGTSTDPGTGQTVVITGAGSLYRPGGVSASNGTVYVSNTGSNVVAAVGSDGTTSVIAGSLDGHGDNGNGGKATDATLYQPAGTAEDAKGDVFIADSADNVVREITPNGVIRRFAGTGKAGSQLSPLGAKFSELDHPEGLAVTPSGDLLIADTYNNRVLSVTPSGRITVVAGDGRAGYSGDGGRGAFARLAQPAGVATDSQGNIYIADSANNVIRRVDAKTGIITTVAGDYAADQADGGLGGFSGDGGPATQAQLDDPQGVAVDGAGDLFIADTFNNAIREVTPNGIISTVVNSAGAGGAAPSPGWSSGSEISLSKLNSPDAVAIDPSTDALYIADTGNDAIEEIVDLAQPGTAAGPTAP